MTDQWFLRRGDRTFGPLTAAQLRQLAATGRLSPADQLRKDGTDRFLPASDVKGLFPTAAVVPTPSAAAAPNPPAGRPGSLPWVWVGAGCVLASGLALGTLVLAVVLVSRSWNRPPADSGNGSPSAQLRPGPGGEVKAARPDIPPGGGADQPAGALSPEDVELLKAASVPYLHNGQTVTGEPPEKRVKFALREAGNPLQTPRSRIAALILAEHVYASVWDKETDAYKELETGFADVLRAGSFLSVLEEIARKTPGDENFRDTLGSRGIERWVDEARNSKTRQAQWGAKQCQATADKAGTVGETFRPRLGRADLAAAGTLAFRPLYAFPFRYVVKITYTGEHPLTDVVLVGRLATTGASSELTANQKRILAFDQAAGSGDKVADIRKMFEAQNYLYSMPRATCAYVGTLRPGDVIQLPLAGDSLFGFSHSVVRGGSVSLYSAQGQVHEHPLRFTGLLHEGPRRAEMVIKPGMTRAEVLDHLGELTPLDLATWKLPIRPDPSRLRPDTDYFWWSNTDALPCLIVGFREEKVVSAEMLDAEAGQANRLVLGEDGTAKRDGEFTRDNPRTSIRRAPSVEKRYLVKLDAGTTYRVTVQHHGTTPPDVLIFSPPQATLLDRRYTKQPATNSVTVDFRVSTTATYHIMCVCPLNGLCKFTVTIARQ